MKKYIKPELYIIIFDMEDILSDSNGIQQGFDGGFGNPDASGDFNDLF